MSPLKPGNQEQRRPHQRLRVLGDLEEVTTRLGPNLDAAAGKKTGPVQMEITGTIYTGP